nr:MAG TPA: hypothetical protein [Caudoviricetes sp.]
MPKNLVFFRFNHIYRISCFFEFWNHLSVESL